MKLTVPQAAVLPFQILESLNLPCGYERSFKFTEQNILANRYLLGINVIDTNTEDLIGICRQLQMPGVLLAQFQAGLEGANLVFLGFEADAHGGALFKIYLEYWDQLQAKRLLSDTEPDHYLLHKGFKWQYDAPEKNLVTEYHCQPGLSIETICQRISRHYTSLPGSACQKAIFDIIELAQARQTGQEFIYVEVSEPGNTRQSFDLNLYPAGLVVNDVLGPVEDAATSLNIDPARLKQLEHLVKDKLLGHISAGVARNGKEYFTLYYEN